MTALLIARLLAASRSGAIAIDAEGRVALLNDAAGRLLGLPPGEQIGRPLAEALAPHPALARLLAEAATQEAPPTKAELPVAIDGRERTIGFTVHPARDERGRPIGALVLLKELSQIETDLEATLARERLAAVGAMAAAIAHEMRNPLAGIRLSASMLKRRIDPGLGEAALLDEIIAEVRKLEETVNRCLTYLRPLTLAAEEVDVNRVVREALALCEASHPGLLGRIAAGEAAIRVDLRLADGLPAVIGDPNRLREAVANLLTNAVEAMRGGGTLSVATGLLPDGPAGPLDRSGTPAGAGRLGGGPAVTITVADTGPGIEPDILDKIFYPFFTTKADGSGVGLATVQKIVTGHGGRIEVASEPGRGATFRIALPLRAADRRLQVESGPQGRGEGDGPPDGSAGRPGRLRVRA